MASAAARGVPTGGVVVSPAMRIVPLGPEVTVSAGSAAVFTSSHAVDRACPEPGAVAFCVGDFTASRAVDRGFDARVADGDATALVQLLAADAGETPLVYLRGEHVSHDLAADLAQHRLSVIEHVVYGQEACDPSPEARALLASDDTIVLPLFSARTATMVHGWIPTSRPNILALAISADVAAAWGEAARVAAAPNAKAMLDDLQAIYATSGNG